MDSSAFNPGDYVVRPSHKGIRGQVLWTDGSDIYVCWETGYEPYRRHDASELEKANVLDMLVQGRTTDYQFCSSYTRCSRCGRKTSLTRYGSKCSHCNREFV